MKQTILMIDDDSFYLREYEELLKEDYKVITANNMAEGLNLLKSNNPKLLLLDITMSKEFEGIEILPDLRKKYRWMPIIMVTNKDSHTLFQSAQKFGAVDYFVKSSKLTELKNLINSTLLKFGKDIKKGNEIIVESAIMKNTFSTAKNIAQYDNAVLLVGESGTGKEVLARFIHKNSQRASAPFQAVNCGAFNENLIESELFGHEKGSFTGAYSKHKGKIELSNNGTLFLDEIEDLSLHAQSVLLRVLQEKKISSVGGNKTINVDFRLIAASKKDLKTQFENGKFRDDLYYRIASYIITIPSLNKRKKDILPMAYFFMRNFCKQNNIEEKIFSQNTIRLLKSYNWPGNVRELKNIIESAIPNSRTNEIRITDLQIPQSVEDRKDTLNYKIAKNNLLEEFDEKFLRRALIRNKGNVTRTAEEMKISRRYLHEMLHKYQIDLKDKPDK